MPERYRDSATAIAASDEKTDGSNRQIRHISSNAREFTSTVTGNILQPQSIRDSQRNHKKHRCNWDQPIAESDLFIASNISSILDCVFNSGC